MAESTLSLTLANLRSEVQRALGYNRATAWASLSSDVQGNVTAVINRGLRQFYTPMPLPGESMSHEWSFMYPEQSVQLAAAVTSTATTLEITAGVVTKTGGDDFPTWIAGCSIVIAGEWYVVEARSDADTITLRNLDITVASANTVSWTAYQDADDAPDDFAGLYGDAFIESPMPSGRIETVTLGAYKRAMTEHSAGGVPRTGQPTMMTSVPSDIDGGASEGTRYRLLFWPLPTVATRIAYRYRFVPNALDGSSLVYPPGGQVHAETILQSCLAIAATYHQPVRVSDIEMYRERLAASIRMDRAVSRPRVSGYNADRSDDLAYWRHPRTSDPITYNGNAI